MDDLAKDTIGLVGEYLVAAELCKRGIYAQLTLGNHKKTDLLIETESGAGCVSVKTKRGDSWPKVKGISNKCDFLIFVDLQNKSIHEMPDFYILNTKSWKKLIETLVVERKGSSIDLKTNTLIWENSGWEGCKISVKDIAKFKDKWPNANTIKI